MINNPVPWPNRARCAVAFTFDMDADSNLHLAPLNATPAPALKKDLYRIHDRREPMAVVKRMAGIE